MYYEEKFQFSKHYLWIFNENENFSTILHQMQPDFNLVQGIVLLTSIQLFRLGFELGL